MDAQMAKRLKETLESLLHAVFWVHLSSWIEESQMQISTKHDESVTSILIGMIYSRVTPFPSLPQDITQSALIRKMIRPYNHN